MIDLSPETTVRTLFDALNERDYGRAAGAVAESCEWQSVPTETTHRGWRPVVQGLREFVAAFPDWHVEIESLTAEGDRAVVEWTASGTFRHEFRGEAPNGKRFRRRGCAVAEVKGGKIVAYRDYYDRATLLAQLDLLHLL